MKKTLSLLLIIVFILSLCGCDKEDFEFLSDTDNGFADARIEQIFQSIKNHDNDSLKMTFSESFIDCQGDNLYHSIDFLMDYVQGMPVSWSREESPIVFDTSENGEKRKQLVVWFTLHTDEQIYSVFLVDYPIDTVDPNNEGLYSLRIIKIEDEDKLEGVWNEWVTPGIYVCD